MEQLTTIQLTDNEALLFVTFQKHHALIGLLESIGALNVKNGSITINFDNLGRIGSIEKQENFRV